MTLALKPELGQVFTPEPVARRMAEMLLCPEPHLRLLDAGAGSGNLTKAVAEMLCRRPAGDRPKSLQVTAYEIDADLLGPLRETLNCCRANCAEAGIRFTAEIVCRDFLEASSEQPAGGLFSGDDSSFNCAILNPPYQKIQSASEHRGWLRRMGVETSNLYTGFLAAAIRLLKPGGEVVAITPRSFCSGSYFRSFRCDFLNTVALDRLHLFESREETFREAEVLQETLIFHAVKGVPRPESVIITGAEPGRRVPFNEVVAADDPNAFIHIVSHKEAKSAAGRIRALPCRLENLGLSVSTGRVVDFRARAFLRTEPERGTVPLLYPGHLSAGGVTWPLSKSAKPKPSHIIAAIETEALLVPNATYVLLRRFTTKEEKKRLVATVFEAGSVPGDQVGFENHLNYIHCRGAGFDLTLARGLAAFLNSTLADSYFRQFSGHTQVNATDLRSFQYPSTAQLQTIGSRLGSAREQAIVDDILESVINAAAD